MESIENWLARIGSREARTEREQHNLHCGYKRKPLRKESDKTLSFTKAFINGTPHSLYCDCEDCDQNERPNT